MIASYADRDSILDQLILSVERRWGYKALVRLKSSSAVPPIPIIPTGFSQLDSALGTGGVPRGRITELFGAGSSGKATIGIKLIAMAQLNRGIAAYIDLSQTFDPVYAAGLGVDLGRLLIAQPASLSDALKVTTSLACSKEVDLIVFDLPGHVCGSPEMEERRLLMAGGRIPARAGKRPAKAMESQLMSIGLRNLVGLIGKSNTALVFISELSGASGSKDGSGSMAMKFYSSIRVSVSRKSWIRRGMDVAGWLARVTVVKNKLAPPLGTADLEIIYENRLRAA